MLDQNYRISSGIISRGVIKYIKCIYVRILEIHGNNFNISSRIFYILIKITLIKIQQVEKNLLFISVLLKFDPNFISSEILSISNISHLKLRIRNTLYINSLKKKR